MWRAALAVWVYGLAVMLLQAIFPENAVSLPDQPLVLSGFPLGFEAIPLCVMYAVLYSDYVEVPQQIKRTRSSSAMAILIVIALLAYNTGYLRHP